MAESMHMKVFVRCGEGEILYYQKVSVLSYWGNVSTHLSVARIKALSSGLHQFQHYQNSVLS